MQVEKNVIKQDQIVIYQTEDGQTQIDVRLENETVWLTQAQMAELFQKDQSVIARHIKNALKEGELEENSNMQILHNTQCAQGDSEGEMLWLDRQQLATLFGRDYKTISKHINNALKEELADSEEVVAKFATTTKHGAIEGKTQTHEKEYFNLEMVKRSK